MTSICKIAEVRVCIAVLSQKQLLKAIAILAEVRYAMLRDPTEPLEQKLVTRD
jgi:hypothetical protein